MSTATPPTKKLFLNGVLIGEVPATGDTKKDAEIARAYIESKGLHKEVTLVQSMFRQALASASTSAYLYERDLANVPRNGLSAAPFVVNIAFAIELYLKTLGQVHGATLKGHDLLKLFDALPAAAHAAIDAAAPAATAQSVLDGQPTVRECLAQLNGVFVEWRYLYEKSDSKEVKIQHAIFVGRVLHDACVASIHGR
ncbi:hypothetical protein [Burkholderia territorii]|uniref:hypothetical protein n=1 Tax=Burkholderia territorii TaxID=1503055 RepID=UPI00076DBFDD|nr:hypothetical protein [Burkholderia territorii]KWO59950.1 hypothetical protein WT98_30935 [Burkholderia territorii]